MIKYLVAALCLLVPMTALGQGSSQKGANLPHFAIADLPTTCTADRDVVVVTDAATAGSCTSDGGTAASLCVCNSTGTGFEATSGTGTSGTLPVTDDVSMAEGDVDDTKEVRFEVDGLTTGTTRVLTVPDEDIDLHDSQTDHEERYSIYNIVDYGAIADDGLTDTVAIRNAMIACATSPIADGQVYFPHGTWNISDDDADGIGVLLNTGQLCPMYGGGIAYTTVAWLEASDPADVMFEVDTATPGVVFWRAHDMTLRGDGATRPGTLLKYSDSVGSQALDIGNRIWNIHIAGNAGGPGIWIDDGLVNFYATGMRFDPNSAGWGMRIDIDNLPAQGFRMSDFTADLSSSGATGGFVQFVDEGMAYVGVYAFEGARIEAGGWSGSVFQQVSQNSPTPNGLLLSINALSFDVGAAGCIFDNEDTNGVFADDGFDIRMRDSPINSGIVMCGNWGTNVTTPGDVNGSRSLWTVNRASAPNTTPILCADSGTDCIRWNVATACLYYDVNNDDSCDLGEELSANCTACP